MYAVNVSEPRLVSQVVNVCPVACVEISVFLYSELWRFQFSFVYIVYIVTWLM